MVECSAPCETHRSGPDDDAVLGRAVERGFGPVFTAFGHWCAAEVRRLPGHPQVFGVEREGRHLTRMAEPFGLRSRSLHLSRRTGLLAALGDVDGEGLANLLVRARAQPATNGEACDLLGIDGWPPGGADAPVDIAALLGHLWSTGGIMQVRERSRRVRAALLDYLSGMGIRWDDDRPLVLVDLGYAGNIQRTLQQCLRLEGLCKPVVGLYLVTSAGIVWARRNGGRASGFLADTGQPQAFLRRFLAAREVWELASGSPCGTTLDYGQGGPDLAACPYGPTQVAAMERLQAACRAFARRAAEGGEGPASRDRCRRLALDLVETPSRAEAEVIGRWHYDGDAGYASRRLADAGGPLADGRPAYWQAAATVVHG
ncbi:MAG: hypothetical protein H6842_09375 [Rhodospirillaceae bacterium]|nr:hypothetical protein [Rhodospirillaceae bacterium]